MATDTENPPTLYPLSEIPEFILRGKKSEMTVEELEYQSQRLRDENHQLQLRILGVNELARLLQDRNEVVGVLKDRNKRLEMSLLRLENRCANFERQLKSQKSSSVASAKPGQSPFIPGPSRQILEGLMQENGELKKTVNNLQKKGSSGYLVAVVSVCVCTCACICMCEHTCVCMHLYLWCMYVCMYMCLYQLYVCVHVTEHRRIYMVYTQSVHLHACMQRMYPTYGMCMYMYIHVNVTFHACTCMYTGLYLVLSVGCELWLTTAFKFLCPLY